MCGACILQRGVQGPLSTRVITAIAQRGAEVEEYVWSCSAAGLEKVCRFGKQLDSSICIAAQQRLATGGSQNISSTRSEGAYFLVWAPEVPSVDKSLLEVVAHKFDDRVTTRRDPVSKLLMQDATRHLRESAIGNILDNAVVKADHLLTGHRVALGPHQAPTDQ